MNKLKKIDYSILIAVILLVIYGLLMVYSSSNVVSIYRYDDEYYFFKRQLLFAVIGIILMIIITLIDLKKIIKITNILFILSLVCLIAVVIPGIGAVRGGARSWIDIGFFSFQPAEFVKLSLILFLVQLINKIDKIYKIKYVALLITIIVLVFGLIMLQPDFGTGLVIVLSSLILLFIGGVPLKYFFILGGVGIAGMIGLIISAPYRMERILAFLDPWQDPLGSGFQAIQALFSIAPSGLFGLGFNNSMQKHFFLPEPQNDFIFAIVCEELGLIGAFILLGLFLFIIIKIILLSNRIESNYLKLLLLGIGSSLFVQVFINIGVVIGLLPVTGITLPIISYGGSSFIFTLIMLGIVMNISKYREG